MYTHICNREQPEGQEIFAIKPLKPHGGLSFAPHSSVETDTEESTQVQRRETQTPPCSGRSFKVTLEGKHVGCKRLPRCPCKCNLLPQQWGERERRAWHGRQQAEGLGGVLSHGTESRRTRGFTATEPVRG